MSKMELVFTDEEINRFAEKIVDKMKECHDSCPVCSNDYHQEIISTLIRYHACEPAASTIVTRFCPNCGRRLSK